MVVVVSNLIYSQEINILHGYLITKQLFENTLELTVILSIANPTFSHWETFGGAHLASLWQNRVAVPTEYIAIISTH